MNAESQLDLLTTDDRRTGSVNPCVRLYGPGPADERCKQCVHLSVRHASQTIFKCAFRRFSRSAATDHRANWPACGKFKSASAPASKARVERPLFVPLKAEHFDDFESGVKGTEYRLPGPRWNEKVCRIGRRVTLSRGYGKARRLYGVITGFAYYKRPHDLPGFVACYGPDAPEAVCISIQLDERKTL